MSDSTPLKRCAKCLNVYPLSDFHSHPRNKDGRQSYCKHCSNAVVRESKKKNLEKVRSQQRQYATSHKQEIGCYRQENASQINAQRKQYRLDHKAETAAYKLKVKDKYKAHRAKVTREWRLKYPERARAHAIVGRAVRSGKLTKANECARCGAIGRLEAHHEDYSKPLNVIWLCRTCHAIRTLEINEVIGK